MKRNYLDIYVDILRAAMSGAKKTHIVYRANLNFKVVRMYIDRLIDTGMLSPAEDSRDYKTTRRGIEFLDQYNELVTQMKHAPGQKNH
jgi:predicted transcriptional regulator